MCILIFSDFKGKNTNSQTMAYLDDKKRGHNFPPKKVEK